MASDEILKLLGKKYNIAFVENGETTIFGNGVLSYFNEIKNSEKVDFFESFEGVTFSDQAKGGYNRLNQNGTKAIAKKIEDILTSISKAGNVGKFIEQVAKGNELSYGSHEGINKYKKCILFDIGSKERMAITFDGDVLAIEDYHDQKK